MAGTAVTSAPVTGTSLNGGGGGPPSASDLNAFRIATVMDRLSRRIRGHRRSNPVEFLNLCLSLARGIDFAIANHEVPGRSQELPSLVKQVCQNKNDFLLQAAIMVLMISVKSACQSGWFSDGDSEELSNLAKEIASTFCSVSNFNTEPSCSLTVISTIMSRFYPRMKMGHIFAFLEVKPGFDAYVSDFKISKNAKSSPGDKIRLFVVQTDNIETSSCLVTPAKVNFLLNGRGVDRRTNLSMDTGPQIPTVVTHLLKFGSNLVQAVGEFNGNYIIAVAFMSEMPKLDSNTLQDYEQTAPVTVDSDSEVIVGQSRISLNCPISFRQIRTPVKGHSCKHIQCVDFDNYIDINSRRPSWRCPHCNQHVCFTDIRIDQKMVKILKEVGPNVSGVVVSSDGSWNVIESEDIAQKPEDKTSNTGQDESQQPMDVLDLTQTDDAMDAVATCRTEERKHFPNAHQHQLMAQTTLSSPIGDTDGVNQRTADVAYDLWSNVLANSVPQSETSLPNTLQLQQYQFGNPSTSNEYGRFPSLPRHVSRTPVAVQARTSASVSQQSPRNSVNPFIPTGLSAASQASPTAAPHANLHQHPVVQQTYPFQSARPAPQQNAGFHVTSPVPNVSRISNERHSSSQQMANLRMPQPMSQSSVQPSSGSFSRPQSHIRVSQERPVHRTGVASTQAELIAAANRTAQMAFDPLRATPSYSRNLDGRSAPSLGDQRGNMGAAPQPITSTDPTEMNWRPAGRMRGALSGQAYADALNQFIIRPSQQAQAARPVSNVNPVPTVGGLQGTPLPNSPAGPPTGWPVGSDRLPDGSSGTQT